MSTPPHLVDVPIAACVHYRGFRYGGFSNHLYEDYAVGLAQGVSPETLRRQFVRRLLGLQADHFGAALGLPLSRRYPSWDYPWNPAQPIQAYTAATNPDPVCHWTPDGILASKVNYEFGWHENAFQSIREHGYQPDTFSYIRVLEFIGRRTTRYLVKDGNHRLASMQALGQTMCRVRVDRRWYLREPLAPFWPGTLFRGYTIADARLIFGRYFWTHNPPIPESDEVSVIINDEPLQVVV